MFTNFHESSRNVGVVGALLGLFLLAGLTGLGMAVFAALDDGPGKKISVASKIAEQEMLLEDRKANLAALEEKLAANEELALISGQVDDAQIALDLEEEQISKLESEKARLGEDLAAVTSDFNNYRDRYRIAERSAAVGEVLDLSETKGDDYKECTVTGISPLHLSIRRSTGSEGIPFQEIPAALRDRFQFSEDEAEAYQKVLNEATAARQQQHGEWKEKQKEEQAKQARIDMSKKAQQNEVDAVAKRKEAEQHRASSKEWSKKAAQYRSEAARAKASGQITSKDGLARQADAKAARFNRSAIQSEKEAVRLETEAAQLRSRLAELPTDE